MLTPGKSICTSTGEENDFCDEPRDTQALLATIPPPKRMYAWMKYGVCGIVLAVILVTVQKSLARYQALPLLNADLGNDIVATGVEEAVEGQWEDALDSSRQLSESVRLNIEKIRQHADKARDSMKSWTRSHIFRDAKELAEYVSRSAHASALLSEGESDFRALCGTLAGSFDVIADELTEKLNSGDQTSQHITITDAQSMLRGTIGQALADLEPIRQKFSYAQGEFQTLQSLSDAYKDKIEVNIEELYEKRNHAMQNVGVDAGAAAVVSCGPAAAMAAGATMGVGAPVVLAACGIGVGTATVGVAALVTIIHSTESMAKQMQAQADNFGSLATACSDAKKSARKDYKQLAEVRKELIVERVQIMRSSVKAWKTKVLPSMRQLVKDLHEKAGQ